jgi:hypothetical protein
VTSCAFADEQTKIAATKPSANFSRIFFSSPRRVRALGRLSCISYIVMSRLESQTKAVGAF